MSVCLYFLPHLFKALVCSHPDKADIETGSYSIPEGRAAASSSTAVAAAEAGARALDGVTVQGPSVESERDSSALLVLND